MRRPCSLRRSPGMPPPRPPGRRPGDIAPPGSATATALNVGELAGVSHHRRRRRSQHRRCLGRRARGGRVRCDPRPRAGVAGPAPARAAAPSSTPAQPLPAGAQVAPWHRRRHRPAPPTRNRPSTVPRRPPPVLMSPTLPISACCSRSRPPSTGRRRASERARRTGINLGLADIARFDPAPLRGQLRRPGPAPTWWASTGRKSGPTSSSVPVCAVELTGLLGLSCLEFSAGLAGGLLGGDAEVLGITSSWPPCSTRWRPSAPPPPPVPARSRSAFFHRGRPKRPATWRRRLRRRPIRRVRCQGPCPGRGAARRPGRGGTDGPPGVGAAPPRAAPHDRLIDGGQ